jgi:signal transduction histidine kinase
MSTTQATVLSSPLARPAATAVTTRPLLLRGIEGRAAQYAFALMLSAFSIAGTFLIKLGANADTTLVLFIPVLGAAWFGGLRAGAATVVLVTAAAAFVEFDPTFSFSIDTTSDTTRFVLFVVLAVGAAFSVSRLRDLQEQRDRHTELIAALNAELREANDAKDAFVGLVAHELRTPVTVISGNLQLLSRPTAALDADAATIAMRDARDEARRLGEIIEQLLILARVDRGLTAPSEPVLLHAEVQHAVDEFRRRNDGVELHVSAPHVEPIAEASPVYVRQVLLNLLSNAAKYGAGTPVTVDVGIAGSFATVSVTDGGPGIPAGSIDRIFEPFFRAPETATRAPGAGIGLTVCRRLMRAQGGEITVENRRGSGATFTMRLPLANGSARFSSS